MLGPDLPKPKVEECVTYRKVGERVRSRKQRNKALTLAHAQTIHYTSN